MALLTTTVVAQDPALPDRAEDRFLQQLIRQQFFDLARNYCEQQIQRAATPAQTARWQLRIGEIYATQAWMSSTESRGELLTLAIEKSTTYLQTQTPGPEDQFLLRIQQAELLTQSVRMHLVVTEGGRLFARHVRDSVSLTTASPQDRPSQSALPAQLQESLDRSEALLQDLEKQLGTLKRELDNRRVLQIRDRLKLQLLRTRLLRWRLTRRLKPSGDLLLQIDEGLMALARSTRSSDVESQARLLLAELSLATADREQFDLRIRSPRAEDLRQHWTGPTFDRVRSELSRQDPSAAGRLLEDVSTNNSVQQQHKIWLQLECRRGDRELAAELQDRKRIAATQQAFEEEMTRAGGQLVGVFRDAAQQTSSRYRLVEAVGVQIADVVQTVEQEKTRGNFAAALRLIDRTLTRLPPTRHAPRAALQLRAGELQIAAKQWPDAVTRLEQATDLFAQVQRRREQATADLLRIFCLSRLCRTPADRNRYEQALESHLQQFAQQPTAVQARQWLLLAVGAQDPARVAALTLETARSATEPRAKLAAWSQFATAFESALQQQQLTGRSFARQDALEAEFRSEIRQLQEDPIRYPPTELLPLTSLQLVLDFTAAVAQKTPLDEYAARVQQLRRQAAAPTPLSDLQQQQVLLRLNLLDVIIAARTNALPDQLDRARRRLLSEPVDRENLAEQLSQHINPQQEQSGDVWLAGVGLELMTPLLEGTDGRAAEIDRLIRQLSLVQKFTTVTQQPALNGRWVDTLLQQPLSDAQTQQLAATLATGDAPGTDSQPARAGRQKFWKQVLTSRPKGSDLWLTSQLRLAELEFQQEQYAAARRRLGVVDTLYPDWGNPQRQQEAGRLQQQLQSSAPRK